MSSIEDRIRERAEEERRRSANTSILATRENQSATAARANVLSRRIGIPADVIERNIQEIEQRDAARNRMRRVEQSTPYVQNWFSQPRNSAAGNEDAERLAKLAENERYWKKALAGQGEIKAINQPDANLWSYAKGIWNRLTGGFEQMEAGTKMALSDALPTWKSVDPATGKMRDTPDFTIENARKQYQRAEARMQINDPLFESSTAEGVYSGVASFTQQLPGLVASALTRSPVPALASAGGMTGTQSYGKYRARGGTPGEAAVGGLGEGAVEVGTELIPITRFLGAFGKNTTKGFLKELGISVLADIPGEQIATLAQDALDTAIANPDATWSQYLADRPDAAYQTLIATLTQNAITGGLGYAGRTAVRRAETRLGTSIMDNIMADAAETGLRQSDPEAFQKFIDGFAQNTPIENVYIPGEAVRELLQDGYRDDPFWRDYADQIDEAVALDGDVVLPLGAVATHLAGTPEWNVLREEARFSAGGMSEAELRSLEESYRDSIDQMEGRLRETADQAAKAAEPAMRVYQDIRQQLQDAGYRPDVADAYAQWWTANRETWGEALGMTAFQYHENNPVQFRRVLPQGLAKAIPADGLDVVINAMRGGKDAKVNRGSSLLEFIAKRGGVEDKGGDITSMGGDKWHREKRFRKRLLKPFDEAQGNLIGSSGANPNSIENLFDAAVSEGYFPDLYSRRENGEALDVNNFIDAIGQELRGDPIYASEGDGENATNLLREAADDLRQLLNERGVDPDTASKSDIEKAVSARQEEAQLGEGAPFFDQNGKPLVVVHNLSAEGFRQAETVGGLAAPSIAVVRADIPFNNFGEITLVGSPDMSMAGQAYNADVYSPRQPRARFDISKPALNKLHGDVKAAQDDLQSDYGDRQKLDPDEISKEGIAALENSDAVRLTFLRSIGEDVRIVYQKKPEVDARLHGFKGTRYQIQDDPEFAVALKAVLEDKIVARQADAGDNDITDRLRETYFYEDGSINQRILSDYAYQAAERAGPRKVSKYETRTRIEKKLNATKKRTAQFEKWVSDEYGSLIAGRFFEDRKSGRRRPYTMDALVRDMTRTVRDGEGFNYGVGSLRSNVAKRFRSVAQIAKDRDHIVSDEEMDKVKNEASDEMFALGEKFSRYHGSGKDFGWMDIFTEFLKDLSKGRTREWQTSIFNEPVPDSLLNEARDFLAKLANLPTEYFEVKVQRPVRFSEFEAAIVPEGTAKDVIDGLKSHGLKIETYKRDHKGGDRTAAIKKVAKGQFFQSAFHGSPHKFDRFSTDSIGSGEGNQVFGWGLYFAGRREIAEFYRDQLSPVEHTPVDGSLPIASKVAAAMDDNGSVFRGPRSFERAVNVVRADLEQSITAAEAMQEMGFGGDWQGSIENAENQILELAQVKPEDITANVSGRLYEVEIPEDGEFMLWDKPLSEQPPKVRAALDELGVSLEEGGKYPDTGADVYRRIEREMTRQGALPADKMASLALHDLGIAGIKYLDNQGRTTRSEDAIRADYEAEIASLENRRGLGDDAALDRRIADTRAEMEAALEDAKANTTHNYVVFDDSRVSITAYEQDGGAGPRGRVSGGIISGNQGPAIIELFDGSDLSTVIHESAHLWLEEFKRNAALDNAPDWMRDDWQTVQGWFADNGYAVAEDGTIPTEAHELWARGVERHALEGKSPSIALKRIFDRFRAWLLTIYKHVNNLNAPITPEVRRVMDRMVSSQEAIDEMGERQQVQARFESAEQAGMTQAEFAAYRQTADEARSDAFDALLYRTMASIRAERTKVWKDEQARVRDEVSASVDKRPMFRALHLLRTGRFLDDPERAPMKVKLDRAWIVDRFGEDALSLIPKNVPPIYKEGGDNPDTIANLAGFQSGDEMVRALMGIEQARQTMRGEGDRRSVRERTIADETADIMAQRHGDMLNDGSIEEEALAAIHNEKEGELIAAENRAMAKRSNQRPTAYSMAREWAARKIAEGKVVDVASKSALQRYARAQAKAAKAFEAALVSGDVEEAFRQSEIRLLNHALIAEAKKAADKVDVAVSRLSRIASQRQRKSVDQEYWDRARDLLAKFEFRARSQKSLDEVEAFAAWAERKAAEGVDVVVPPRLEADGVHYSRMSVEELLGLDESVGQLLHLGRNKKTMLDAKERREFDAIVGEAVSTVEDLPQRKKNNRMRPNWLDEKKAAVASADAALLKMEQVFDWLDNGNSNGVFNRLVFRPIADAQANEKIMVGDYLGKVQDALKELPADTLKRWSEHVETPLLNRETGQPFSLTRQELVSMALNVGNEGNFDKLSRGYGWNRDAIMGVLENELTSQDWQFVQKMWDLIDTLWPQVEALEKRVNGIAPEKVDPRAFTVRVGGDNSRTLDLRGGYYPVVYDVLKSVDADMQSAKNTDALFENIYTRATTPKGFTKERTQVARPVLLSMSVLNRHVTEVIHDITHREAIIAADKILSDRRIVSAVDDALGREVRKQFRPWLQHIANEWAMDRRGLDGWEAVARKLRTHSTIIGMGYRLTTIMAQLAGYAGVAEKVGVAPIANGVKAMSRDPIGTYDFVMERSKEVAHRMETMERDINANIRDLQGKSGLLADVRRFAFHGIGYMDRVVVIPAWIGSYNMALSDGMTEEEAVYYADKVIRETQGSGAAKDLSAVQRSNEWMRLATMFYSYASAFYNRQRTLGRDTAQAISQRNVAAFPGLLARAWWLFAVSPIMGALPGAILSGGGPDEDEGWLMWAFSVMAGNMFYGIPIARDIASAAATGFDYSFTPATRAVETLMQAVGDLSAILDFDEDTEPSKRSVKNAVESVGYVAKLPVGQVSNAAQFITDWANGEVDPDGVGDWLTGLQRGKLEE